MERSLDQHTALRAVVGIAETAGRNGYISKEGNGGIGSVRAAWSLIPGVK